MLKIKHSTRICRKKFGLPFKKKVSCTEHVRNERDENLKLV